MNEDARHVASRERWDALWRRLEVQEDLAGLYDEVMTAWEEPGRAYHDAGHLAACLEELDAHGGGGRDEVELAIWFHDSVYAPRRGDNEEKSADWARHAVARAGLGEALGRRVAELILATRHDGVPSTDDARLLVDIDLAILGRPPEVFDRYEEAVRQEYRWVPGFLYRRKRREVLASFLDRPSIYSTSPFQEHYEARARENLARSIARLGG